MLSTQAIVVNHVRQAVGVLWNRDENPFSPFGSQRTRFNPSHSAEERARRCADGVALVTILVGEKPINSAYAGAVFLEQLSDEVKQKFPAGVQFSYEGFPDFSPYAKATVVLANGFGSSRNEDKVRAKRQWESEHGVSLEESDCTWHHHEDGRTMMLVNRLLHYQVKHTGGWPITGKLGTRRVEE